MSRRAGAPRLHAVVLAGGAGERFWPASRAHHPKPLLEVSGGRSLLAATLARAARLAPSERTWLVCGHEHAGAMRRESGLPRRQMLVEPRRRNTAMAVGLAAARIEAEDPEAVMAVLSADHHIPDTRRFVACMRRAAAAAAGGDVLVTLGVRPSRPETGYGYIRLGAEADSHHPGLHRVARFVEKPDAARARRYAASDRYLWNAGIFAWTPRALLEEIETHEPDLARALRPLRSGASAPRGTLGARAGWSRAAVLERAYRRAPSVPIDVAVLERTRRIWCLPVEFRWSDVGTWASLAEELGVGPDVSHVIDGEAVLDDSPGNLVWAGDRPVVLLGVEGLAVIDSGDALLVTRLDRSGELRRVVARLRERGHGDLI